MTTKPHLKIPSLSFPAGSSSEIERGRYHLQREMLESCKRNKQNHNAVKWHKPPRAPEQTLDGSSVNAPALLGFVELVWSCCLQLPRPPKGSTNGPVEIKGVYEPPLEGPGMCSSSHSRIKCYSMLFEVEAAALECESMHSKTDSSGKTEVSSGTSSVGAHVQNVEHLKNSLCLLKKKSAHRLSSVHLGASINRVETSFPSGHVPPLSGRFELQPSVFVDLTRFSS